MSPSTSPRQVTEQINGIRMHYVECGTGPSVVLLHGFPETHRSWDLQVPALVAAGRRVIAPDLRGYAETEQPHAGYDLGTLAADVAALIEETSSAPAALVGHDWGGGVAWQVAMRYPSLLEQLIVIDCPHPALFARALRRDRRQLRRSWYMFFFQLPLLPELVLARDHGAALQRMFETESPGSPTELVAAEVSALSAPGALRGPLAYYRTMFRHSLKPMLRGGLHIPGDRIDLPVTLIWGERDSYLGTELIDGTERFAPRVRSHIVPGAGHFVHHERPDEVNALLSAALARKE